MNDDLLSTFLQAPAPTVAPSTPAVPGTGGDLLSSFLTPAGQTYNHVQVPWLGPMSDQQWAQSEAAGQNVNNLPIDRITNLSDAERALKQTGSYLAGQAEGIPSELEKDFSAAKNMTGSGIADIRSGNYLPSFPSSDPSTWQGGGLLKTAAGAGGMLTSPITAVTQKLVAEPVTEATGNPQAGNVAGMAAAALAANAVPSVLRNTPADAETLRLANVAQQNGIPIRASQISTSPFIQKLDQVAGWIPGSGRSAENASQQSAFTRAVSHSFGEDTDQITRQTINDAKTRIGGVLNNIENRTPVALNSQVMNNIGQVENDAARAFTPNSTQYQQIRNQVDQIMNVAAHHGGTVPGDVWANFLHQGSPLSRLENSADPDVGQLASQLKGVVRDAIQSQATPGDAAAYGNARFQYKNMKTVEPLVTTGTPGEISPLGLAQKVRTKFDTTNAGPLGDLSDAAQRFLRQPRDSGTPLGEKVLGLMSSPGLMAGSAIAGSQLGFSIPEALGFGFAAPMVNAGVARLASGLLNNPIYRNALLRGPGSTTDSLAKELIRGAAPNIVPATQSNPR